MLLASLLSCVVFVSSARAECDEARVAVARDTVVEARTAVRCLINAARARHGLRPVRPNGRLHRAATRHSRDMVRRGYLAHDSPGGGGIVSRALAVGYLRPNSAWTIGEVIGWGTGRRATPRVMVRSWMRSPAHRAIILSPAYRDFAIGIALGTLWQRQGVAFTTDFGARG